MLSVTPVLAGGEDFKLKSLSAAGNHEIISLDRSTPFQGVIRQVNGLMPWGLESFSPRGPTCQRLAQGHRTAPIPYISSPILAMA